MPGGIAAGDARRENVKGRGIVLQHETGVQHHGTYVVARLVILGQRCDPAAERFHRSDDRGLVDYVVEVAHKEAADLAYGEPGLLQLVEAHGQRGLVRRHGIVDPLPSGRHETLGLVARRPDDQLADGIGDPGLAAAVGERQHLPQKALQFGVWQLGGGRRQGGLERVPVVLHGHQADPRAEQQVLRAVIAGHNLAHLQQNLLHRLRALLLEEGVDRPRQQAHRIAGRGVVDELGNDLQHPGVVPLRHVGQQVPLAHAAAHLLGQRRDGQHLLRPRDHLREVALLHQVAVDKPQAADGQGGIAPVGFEHARARLFDLPR